MIFWLWHHFSVSTGELVSICLPVLPPVRKCRVVDPGLQRLASSSVREAGWLARDTDTEEAGWPEIQIQ